jgi:hypothetical protein
MRALLVSASETEDGSIRISLDDVTRSDNDGRSWVLDAHMTSKTFDQETLDEMSFSDKDLENMGVAIMARLSAFKNRGEL